MPIERAKFIKVLMMTTADNDGEALAAMRQANKMLAAAGLTWETAFNNVGGNPIPNQQRPTTPRSQPTGFYGAPQWRDPKRQHKPDFKAAAQRAKGQTGRGTADIRNLGRITDPKISNMLSSLLRDIKGDFRDMIESINVFWEDNGYVTPKQYDVILNSYERLK